MGYRMNAMLDRPIYFIVVLWGERFRGYFLDYCLPSLLAPGNLPALATRTRSKLLIATTPADWAALQAAPIFRAASRHVDLELIEIPPCPPTVSGCEHMGIGHQRGCMMAHRDRAYAAILTPDCMLSDGSVARMQELALSGCQLVVVAALRFGEEKFFSNLRAMGAVPDESRRETGTPLVITGAQMAGAAGNGLHPETLAYEWDEPGFLLVGPAAWWRGPDGDGMLVHCLSWAPVLLDYGAIDGHDASTLDHWTVDGDYLYRNSDTLTNIHVVQDSDEIFLASWERAAHAPINKHPVPCFGHLVAKVQFGANFKSAFYDPLKRRLFFLPVRWHGRELNPKWDALEAQAMRELRRYVTPADETVLAGADGFAEKARRLAGHALAALFMLLRPVFIVAFHRKAVWRRLTQAASGDPAALRRLFWYMRLFVLNK